MNLFVGTNNKTVNNLQSRPTHSNQVAAELSLFIRRMIVARLFLVERRQVNNFDFIALYIPLLEGDLWGLIKNERKLKLRLTLAEVISLI